MPKIGPIQSFICRVDTAHVFERDLLENNDDDGTREVWWSTALTHLLAPQTHLGDYGVP